MQSFTHINTEFFSASLSFSRESIHLEEDSRDSLPSDQEGALPPSPEPLGLSPLNPFSVDTMLECNYAMRYYVSNCAETSHQGGKKVRVDNFYK